MNIGSSRLNFELLPLETKGRTNTHTLNIQIDDSVVWPVRGDDTARVEIQIDDLLAHLTEFWKPLMLRQVYPIDVSPIRPSYLRQKAESRWSELRFVEVQREEEAVANFEEAHDLSRAFAGVYGLPSFWIMRSGEYFTLETAGAVWHLPLDDVRSALVKVGDGICEILGNANRERWYAAIVAWRQRYSGDPISLLAWSVGLDRTIATTLVQEGELKAPIDFEDVANDNDELRIAARMACALPTDQIRQVLKLARQFSGREASRLRTLSDECLAHIAEKHQRARPFEQGEAAARFVREKLEIVGHGPVPVFAIAEELGVELRHMPSEPSTLMGLAIWGRHHGPGVFLNEASQIILKNKKQDVISSRGARVTLAHELCHLLLDGGQAVSAIEVLKAKTPPSVEQRAKSFAGEFLLPTHIASQYWHDAGRPRSHAELTVLTHKLYEIYEVTHSVAAWKLEHAARDHGVDIAAQLDEVAPWR